MIRHVAGIAEIVEDVNEALKFYQDTMGLTVADRSGDDYAMITVPGIGHFGIWNRGHAAESVFGSRDRADEIPLGFTLEFEVDETGSASERISDKGYSIAQQPREEPWGQKTFRMFSPGGSVLGFAETPWARSVKTQLEMEDGG